MPPQPVAPVLDPRACGDKVCITIEEAVALAKYRARVDDRDAAIARCSLVEVVRE